MTTELKFMFEFLFVINDMQGKIIAARSKGVDVEESIKRVDKLIEIYKGFDAYYYQAHFAQQKILFLEDQNLQLAKKMGELKEENLKLLKSLEWQQ